MILNEKLDGINISMLGLASNQVKTDAHQHVILYIELFVKIEWTCSHLTSPDEKIFLGFAVLVNQGLLNHLRQTDHHLNLLPRVCKKPPGITNGI
ncbi:hypothetical protein ECG_06517 [Echinococcus granulosus]|nr:hypothetical protein ECG_06517 [Echinococcus granulosus]